MRILLVRLRQIGDVVFTTPALRAIRERFPAAHISYIVEPAAAPVVRLNPHLDEVIVAPRRRGLGGFLADLTLGRRLRRSRFDLAVDFHGGPRAALLTWLSGAERRIGYTIPGRSWIYTDRVHRTRELRPRHSVESQWELLEPLGIAGPDRRRFPVEMPVDEAAATAVGERLEANGVSRHALIVIHVSAGNPFRRWPIDAFASVAAELVRVDASRRVLFTSGPAERSALDAAIARARATAGPRAAKRIVDCGDFSLPELRALVDGAALYIGGDSGPMHVATASAVAMVSLYGPTLPARSEPWRAAGRSEAVQVSALDCRPCDQRVCVHGDFRCLGWIAPGEVVAAAERLLQKNG